MFPGRKKNTRKCRIWRSDLVNMKSISRVMEDILECRMLYKGSSFTGLYQYMVVRSGLFVHRGVSIHGGFQTITVSTVRYNITI